MTAMVRIPFEKNRNNSTWREKMKTLFVTLFVCGAVLAFAETAHATCSGHTCRGLIERVYVTAGGDVSVYLDQDTSGLTCTSDSRSYLTLRKGHAAEESIYKMILALFLSGKQIAIRVESNVCTIIYTYADS